MRRSGSLLIIVAGISALLVAMGMAFLMWMRADAEESVMIVREAQSRIMLHAAMSYIQETSRLGWGAEASGWTDVRDGSQGPKTTDFATWRPKAVPLTPGVWPSPGSAVRCPMYVMEQTPRAIRPVYAYNPVTNFAASRKTVASYQVLDPQPVAQVFDGGTPNDGSFIRGITLPRANSENLSWFRVYREVAADHNGDRVPYFDTVDLGTNHAVFVVTCGAGATEGWRTFAEAPAGTFTDAAMFDYLRTSERILWYRVAWSPSIGDFTLKIARNDTWASHDDSMHPPNGRNITGAGGGGKKPRAFFGSIAWIQRLDREPPAW